MNDPRGRIGPAVQVPGSSRLARAWFERQQADLLDTRYYHAVFTLPHALLPLCVARPAELYRLLFDAAAHRGRALSVSLGIGMGATKP